MEAAVFSTLYLDLVEGLKRKKATQVRDCTLLHATARYATARYATVPTVSYPVLPYPLLQGSTQRLGTIDRDLKDQSMHEFGILIKAVLSDEMVSTI